MMSNTSYLRRLRSLERPREDDDALDPESDSLSEAESDDLDDPDDHSDNFDSHSYHCVAMGSVWWAQLRVRRFRFRH